MIDPRVPIRLGEEVDAARAENAALRAALEELWRIRVGMGDDYGDDPVAVINALKAERDAALSRAEEAMLEEVCEEGDIARGEFLGRDREWKAACAGLDAALSREAELQRQLCRAREAWEAYLLCPQECFDDSEGHGYDMQRICTDVFSSTSPCRHEARVKQLEEAVNTDHGEIIKDMDIPDLKSAEKNAIRLALVEIRRRAGKEGGG